MSGVTVAFGLLCQVGCILAWARYTSLHAALLGPPHCICTLHILFLVAYREKLLKQMLQQVRMSRQRLPNQISTNCPRGPTAKGRQSLTLPQMERPLCCPQTCYL